MEKTKEPQYQIQLELKNQKGLCPLGLVTNQLWNDDPRHLVFLMARYKFVAKMLSGKKRVLEVGCGDAFGSRLVLQEVESLTAVDFDPVFVNDVKSRMQDNWHFECMTHDMIDGPLPGEFDAAYSIDVIEHIKRIDEEQFLRNIVGSLSKYGVLIIGTPTIQSQIHASPASKAGHINCKDHKEIKQLLSKFFHNIFLFSMNDEVVHTGFYPMAHYFMALCCDKK